MSSAEIRSVFERAGGIIECDGAVDGASEGWAMVSMRSEETATAAIRMFRELRNPIGKDREESWNKQNEGGVDMFRDFGSLLVDSSTKSTRCLVTRKF